MAERGDLTVLHEPFGNLKNYGETDVDGHATVLCLASDLAMLSAGLRDCPPDGVAVVTLGHAGPLTASPGPSRRAARPRPGYRKPAPAPSLPRLRAAKETCEMDPAYSVARTCRYLGSLGQITGLG